MRSAVVLALFGLVIGAVYACGIFPTTDGLAGGAPTPVVDASDDGGRDGGGQGDGAPDAGDGAPGIDAGPDAPGCPSGRGPAMISVGAFCIDSTEVTMKQYSEFLADAGTTPQDAPDGCAWNTTVEPNPAGGGLYDPTKYPNLPVNSINWCDAYAFCQWAGKRLCGAIAGGSAPYASYADASANQWAYACTKAGTRDFPYGDDYNGADGCNGGDAGLKQTPLLVDVGSRTGCVGGFDGIFDMSGNVWEYIDACEPCEAGRCCRAVGGSYGNSESNLRCEAPTPPLFTDHDKDIAIGFRCCSP